MLVSQDEFCTARLAGRIRTASLAGRIRSASLAGRIGTASLAGRIRGASLVGRMNSVRTNGVPTATEPRRNRDGEGTTAIPEIRPPGRSKRCFPDGGESL